MLWTKQGQAKSKGRSRSRSRKRSTLDLGSGDGKQQVVCTAEGAGRLEADEAEAEDGVVVEEADVDKPGEDLVTSSFRICVQHLGWICEEDVNWICGEAASRIFCFSPFCYHSSYH